MTLLFWSRLLLYIIAFGAPALHPAVVISYDVRTAFIWFVLVPLEMAIAYFLAPPRLRPGRWLGIALIALLVSAAVVSGFDSSFWIAMAGGAAGFMLTVAVFHIGARVRWVFALEQFFVAFIYYRLLIFSRASEEVFAESAVASGVLFALMIAAFLVHGLVLYAASRRSAFAASTADEADHRRNATERARGRVGREAVAFLAVVLPLVLLVAFVLPAGFLDHNPVVNLLNRPAESRPIPVDEWGDGLANGSLRGGIDGSGDGQNGDDGDLAQHPGGGLEGVPADQWGATGTTGDGPTEQRAVMVVAGSYDPIYAADAYFDAFDTVRGFQRALDEPLNELTTMRLIGTWRDRQRIPDRARRPQEIRFFSTIPDRVLQYRPYAVEPTVYRANYYPFSYHYTSVSRLSTPPPGELARARRMLERDVERLENYLEIELREADREVFQRHLDERVPADGGHFETIDAILRSFFDFQYKAGYDDAVSTAHMVRFIDQTRTGDCVEFSNSAAILGRMAGIPSRVVTGYLASRQLQTLSHLQGLWVLQRQIEELQQYSLRDLYLVTTSHRHSWVQYYVPGYGWIDFEPTAHAIPPAPGDDPNELKVVIPMLDPRSDRIAGFVFPWREVGMLLLILAALTIAGLYAYRYARESYLAAVARRRGYRGARALYTALLMKLAAAGYEFKTPSTTAQEYAARYQELQRFAADYTRLRYREHAADSERGALWQSLLQSYREVVRGSRRDGLRGLLRRAFSLRGLRY
ncbi:MAG: hypothetical protein EA384_07685 [Spirochaetaceae bacterium]|nr:MAG: hypothetical protein EA384_07685 [Spirochaetaceae bacterium]